MVFLDLLFCFLYKDELAWRTAGPLLHFLHFCMTLWRVGSGYTRLRSHNVEYVLLGYACVHITASLHCHTRRRSLHKIHWGQWVHMGKQEGFYWPCSACWGVVRVQVGFYRSSTKNHVCQVSWVYLYTHTHTNMHTHSIHTHTHAHTQTAFSINDSLHRQFLVRNRFSLTIYGSPHVYMWVHAYLYQVHKSMLYWAWNSERRTILNNLPT